MKHEFRFVFDTNVIISALLLKDSIPRKALDKALQHGCLLISDASVEELDLVLRRKGFERYIKEKERIEFLVALVRDSIVVDIAEVIQECRDPRDDIFLELAVNGRATCIVSGDDDLLSMHTFRKIPIISPREFLEHSWGITQSAED